MDVSISACLNWSPWTRVRRKRDDELTLPATPAADPWWQHQVAVLPLWRQKRKASMMFNQPRWGQECSPLATKQNSPSALPSFLLKWDPLKSQRPADPWIDGSLPESQTGLTWRVSPKFTFSETRALLKETESMQLKLLCRHKRRVISTPPSPSLHSSVCQRHNGHEETLIFILEGKTEDVLFSHVTNLIRFGF